MCTYENLLPGKWIMDKWETNILTKKFYTDNIVTFYLHETSYQQTKSTEIFIFKMH